MNRNKKVEFRNIGNMKYKDAWEYQEVLFNKIMDTKQENQKLEEDEKKLTDNYLLFVEHPHVYTLGKSGKEQNLLINHIQLQAKDAEFFHIDRGGDITYHGPGQIVGYPILNLEYFTDGVKDYIYKIEEVVIRVLKEYGIESERLDGAIGVWLDTKVPGRARKICAIGVKTSRWVSMHGFAFNINTDLSYFNHINPCGFTDKAVTSMQQELGQEIDMAEVEEKLKYHFEEVFDMELTF